MLNNISFMPTAPVHARKVGFKGEKEQKEIIHAFATGDYDAIVEISESTRADITDFTEAAKKIRPQQKVLNNLVLLTGAYKPGHEAANRIMPFIATVASQLRT